MRGLQKIKAQFGELIDASARRHGVPVELVAGVIRQESVGKPRAVSRCGAKGLMQLMPATARRFGVKNVFDPAQNIEGGTRYLAWLLDHFKGRTELAVAAYNAGEGAVEKYGNQIPPYRETRKYVPKVLGYSKDYRALIGAPEPTFLPADEEKQPDPPKRRMSRFHPSRKS